jgi:parallel beta-helix repeat protein
MKHSALTSLLLIVLLSSLILVSSSAMPSKAAEARIYIKADGSLQGTKIQGTDNIIRDGDDYRFVGNLTGTLYIEKDNIAIDGAGYTLTGVINRGIVLIERHGVTLKNTRITLGVGYIIDLKNATDCVLTGNTLVGNPQPIPGLPPPVTPLIGPIAINALYTQNITFKDNTITNFSVALAFGQSNGHTVTGNTLTDGFTGIEIEKTFGCVFRNNHMSDCSFSVQAYNYENDLDTSNTVDGKPIYYWINVKDKMVPSDAAYITLIKCSGITIENSQPLGINVFSTTNSTISNVKMTEKRGSGITLMDSSGISVLNSIVCDSAIGIQIESSSNNRISGNNISSHPTQGIRLNNATNNVFSDNIFTNNSVAIRPLGDKPCKDNTISSNNFTKNNVAINLQGNMRIVDNIFEDNGIGISFSGGSGSTITQNTFQNNKNALHFSGSSGNSIYLNNFLRNDQQVTDSGVNTTSTRPTHADSDSTGSLQIVAAHAEGVNFILPPPPSINNWENDGKGNYWIDYKGTDKNGDGVGDTAFQVYENNQDNYPLMRPVVVSGASMSPVEPPAWPEDTNQPNDTQTSKAGPEFPIEYTSAVVATVGIIVALTYVLQKRKKSTK